MSCQAQLMRAGLWVGNAEVSRMLNVARRPHTPTGPRRQRRQRRDGDVTEGLNLRRSAKIVRLKSGGGVAFRLIPREERFYDDFVALAEQIRRGAGAARRDAGARPADLGQGGRDQGSRAQVRLPDARDHPAPAPHLRHAARSRRHPRAGALARRRDGRHRRVGRARPALSDRAASGPTPASWRASSATRPTRSSWR